MKYFYFALLCLLSNSVSAQECLGGGCNNLNKNYPTSINAATSSWGIVNSTQGAFINGGNYAYYNLTAGYTYYWSTCASFGGNTGFDAELTLFKCDGTQCYSDNYCGTGPYLSYFAASSCTVRVLLSAYSNGSYCQTNGPAGPYCTLMWMRSICNTVTKGSTQPQSQTIATGISATFNVSVSGTPPFSYFWYKNGVFIPNSSTINSSSSTNSYTTPALSSNDNNSTYYCLAQNCSNTYQVQSNTATITINSGSSNGSVNVILSPVGAINAGAQWNLDGGNYQSSGGTLSGISAGSHTINFKAVTGWTTPSSQIITVSSGNTTNVTGIYSQTTSQSGSVNVTLSPAGAISAGAQWNLDGGNYQSSGTTLSSISVGSHTINFKGITGWTTPSSQIIIVSSGNTTNVTGLYSQTTSQSGSVNVTLSPAGAMSAGAQWNIDGGNYLSSGTTLSGISVGSHTINFKSVIGWTTPSSQTINVTNGNTTLVTGTYLVVVVNITYWMGAYTKPENNGNFPDEKFLTSATTNAAASLPVKICADGSSATIIKLNCDNPNIDMRNIRFKVEGDPTNQNKDLFGEFNANSYYSTFSIAQVRFTHPSYLSNDNISRNDVLLAYDISNPSVTIIKLPIVVYRAPILFVHGLWGDGNSFTEMDSYFQGKFPNTGIITTRADYSSNNGAAKSFSENASVLPTWINTTIKKAIASNFSCGKIDVICHSMGGVLTRLYLQSSSYLNDIHTLTTINTPHSGTQAANLLQSNLGTAASKAMKKLGMCTDCGAISDLKYNSPHFQNNLNGNIRQVPSLIYTSDSYSPDFSNDWLVMDLTFGANSLFFITSTGILSSSMLPQKLYKDEASDVIVPLSSQNAGNISTHHYNNVTHTKSEKNYDLFDDVKNKLGQNPSGLFFYHNGFQNSNLSMPWWWYNPLIIAYRTSSATDSIKILRPINNSIYKISDTVDLRVKRYSGNSNYLGFALLNNNKIIYYTSSFDSVLNYSYVIPPDIYGQVKTLAFGLNNAGDFDFDSLFFFVNTNSSLINIKSNDNSLFVPLGEYQSINIEGLYSDSIRRNISLMPGINYTSLDTNIISIKSENTFYAKNIGITKIVVSYQGFSDTVEVNVYKGINYNYASFTNAINSICDNGDISFYDQSGGSPIAWQWEFPGGQPSVSNNRNPIVHYTTPGNYSVKLTTIWTDKTDTITVPNYIFIDISPKPNISGSNSICTGNSTILDAGSGYSNYLWSTGETTQTIKDSLAGTVSVMVTDNNGCRGSNNFNLIVNPVLSPSIRILPQASVICSGQKAVIKANTFNGGSTPLFNWYLNGTLAQSGSDSVFTTSGLSADAQVYCSLTSNAGCVSPNSVTSSPVTINVNSPVTPSVDISSKTSICAGEFVTFTAVPINGGNSPIYTWYLNNSQMQTGTSNTFNTPSLNANADVYCIMTSNATCLTQLDATSFIRTVTVIPIVNPVITIAATTPVNICAGKTVTFSSILSGGGTSPAYQWYLNGVATSQNGPNFTTEALNTNSQVYCIVTSSAPCSFPSKSNLINIIVTPIPVPSITISQVSCQGSDVSFSLSIVNGGNAPDYLWTVNGAARGNYSDSNFTLKDARNGDNVQCTLTSSAACVSRFRVTSLPIIINCVIAPVTDIDGLAGFSIMPNPSSGDFIVRMKLTKSKNVSFTLINEKGQIVYTKSAGQLLGNQTINIYTKVLAHGVYQLKTMIGSQSTTSKVIIN